MKKKQSKDNFDEVFEKTDFGALIEKAEVVRGRAGRKKIGEKIAITLPEEILHEIKDLAQEKAIGYQTLIRMMLVEKLKEDKKKKSA